MGLEYALQIMRARKPDGQKSPEKSRSGTSAGDGLGPSTSVTPDTAEELGIEVLELEPPTPNPTPRPPAAASSPAPPKPSAPQSERRGSPRRTTHPQTNRPQLCLSTAALPWVPPPSGEDEPTLELAARAGSESRQLPSMLQQLAVAAVCPDPLASPPLQQQQPRPAAALAHGRVSIGPISTSTTTSTNTNIVNSGTRRRPTEPPQRSVFGGHVSPSGGGGGGAIASPPGSYLSASRVPSPSGGPGGGGGASASAGSSPSRGRRGAGGDSGASSVPVLQLPRVPSIRNRQAQPGSPRGGGATGNGAAAGGAASASESGAARARSMSGGQDYVTTSPGAVGGGGNGGSGGSSGTLPAVRQLGHSRSTRFSSSSIRAQPDGAAATAAAAADGVRVALRAFLADAEVEAEAEGGTGWQRYAGGSSHSPLSLSRSGSLRRLHSYGVSTSGEIRRRTGQGHGQGAHAAAAAAATGGSASASTSGGIDLVAASQSPRPLLVLLPALGHGSGHGHGHGVSGGGVPASTPGTAVSGSRSRAISPAPPGSPKRRPSRGPPSAFEHSVMSVHPHAQAGAAGRRSSAGEELDDQEEDDEVWAAELAALEQWAACTPLDPAVVEATVEQHRALRRLAQLRARLLRARASAGSPVGGAAGGAASAGGPGDGAPGNGGGAAGPANTGGGGGPVPLPSWVGMPTGAGDGEGGPEGARGEQGPTGSLLALASAVTRLPHVDYEAIKDPQYRMALKARFRHARDAGNATAEALREVAGLERQRLVWKSAYG